MPEYRIAEVYLFDTCTHKCGYCWLAHSGQVLDFSQLDRFRDAAFRARVISFFNSRTTPERKWRLLLTGGEPLITPDLDRLADPWLEAGNQLAFYTALLVGERHPGVRYLLAHPFPQTQYVMASYHPEAELDDAAYFHKIGLLRDAGHRVFLRFVGHPARLHRLEELAARCREMDICFYPTTLFTERHPGAYTEAERETLRRHFASLSQHIQLAGGLDTSGLRCHAGSRMIACNLQSGEITRCVLVHRPSLGNVLEDRLEPLDGPAACPEPGIGCTCDVHFQQNIVIGAGEGDSFERMSRGFAEPAAGDPVAEMRARGMGFYPTPSTGMGQVADDTRLFYTIDEVRENYRKARGLPRTSTGRGDLEELSGVVMPVEANHAGARVERGTPMRIRTQAEQWSWAARARLAIPAGLEGPLWLRIRATVLEGQCGFGILNREGTAFLDRGFLTAGSEPATVVLKVDDPAGAGDLVVENSAPGGRRSEVLLDGVTALAGRNRAARG